MKTKNILSISNITRNYIIALIPLVLYGFYKNGFIVYQKGFGSLVDLFSVALIPIISVLIAFLIEYLFSLKKFESSENSFLLLYALIMSCVVNPNIHIGIYAIVLSIVLSLLKLCTRTRNFKFNTISFGKLVFFAIFLILGTSSYLNVYEEQIPQALGFLDVLFGRSSGGLFSTSIILILIGYAFLAKTKLYKKEIPLYMLVTYSIISLSVSLIFGNNEVFMSLFNGMVFFSAVFIAPEIISSPYTKKGKIAYGVFLGALTSLCVIFIHEYIGVFIAILFASFLPKHIDSFFALK